VSVGGQRPVLVVDDDLVALEIMRAMLVDLGYQPRCESQGEVALAQVEHDPPAAIILDLLMPGMDGFEFLRRLRGSSRGGDVPVLVWTGKDLAPEELQRLSRSAQGVMNKSAEGAATLLTELRQHIRSGPRVAASGPISA
jgi:CheY-like chemotaxis protein